MAKISKDFNIRNHAAYEMIHFYNSGFHPNLNNILI